ncbi:Acetyltransferase (GNAT) domain-containing protein [Arenibacter nanhaiticus]|uniref:Acetyltransferase (GNAT) domain-containing protein n=1 Tax=Arenibacter nanhaiticus TaxID=558155 RepID=A0A1M6KM51_9FLAO|nr:GNAT family N-acetyltransferase [Arenibacter nanhaiticus]SHJ59914.1 Acetyltransferase (GNAT) domain-containing protein [Arenibacter nanhaiticus]
MDTPFNSDWFVSTWLKHFKNSIPPKQFEFINGVRFYKHKYLPLYTNIDKNLTKGFDYTIDPKKIKKSNNVFLIYDIPSYYNTPSIKDLKYLKSNHIPQYNGYLTTIKKYSCIDNFLELNFSKSVRKLLRKRENRITKSFNISSKMFYGAIDINSYNTLFDRLFELLTKRFEEKQTNYHIISKWDYIKELTYPMILNKEAALFVMYDDSEPIAMQLCFQHQKKLIGAIPVYDTDYSKYGLGNILTFKVIEWCIKNDMHIFDSSKGDNGIKKQISDIVYRFEFHVLYNPRSVTSNLVALSITSLFRSKQYLRKRNLHTYYHLTRFKLEKILGNHQLNQLNYEIVKEEFDITKVKDILPINYKERKFSFLNRMVCDFLYSSLEKKDDVKLYKNVIATISSDS